uniref:Uncharacterized protein n=1 Tax=Fagus sylvatica TaxID=28930 RepID=A0A2N9IXL9_FAGSY
MTQVRAEARRFEPEPKRSSRCGRCCPGLFGTKGTGLCMKEFNLA